jgi:hypothetical protein
LIGASVAAIILPYQSGTLNKNNIKETTHQQQQQQKHGPR